MQSMADKNVDGRGRVTEDDTGGHRWLGKYIGTSGRSGKSMSVDNDEGACGDGKLKKGKHPRKMRERCCRGLHGCMESFACEWEVRLVAWRLM